VVVERSIASALDPGDPAVLVLPRRRSPGARRRWRALDADEVVAALETIELGGLGLCRPPHADPGAASLVRVLDALGIPRVVLPADRERATWAVGTVGRLVSDGVLAVRRLAEAVASLAATDGAVPSRSWGSTALVVPAIRPPTLGRWALGAWSGCPRCARGGVVGGPCGGCGAPLGAAA
jgi:hypothetical protein